MHYPPPIDTKRVAFRHRKGDANSQEKGSDNDLPSIGSVAWRPWRPTRFARPIRVKGRQGPHATLLLTEDSPVVTIGHFDKLSYRWVEIFGGSRE